MCSAWCRLLRGVSAPRSPALPRSSSSTTACAMRSSAASRQAASAPTVALSGENATFNELAKRLELLDKIRYWRSKSGAEVDFVVRRGERMVAFEVRAGDLPRPIVSRGTHSFLEAYRPTCLGVVNASLRLDTVEEGITVRFVRPWEIDLVLCELER